MTLAGIDNSAAMLEKAKMKLSGQTQHDFDFVCTDLREVQLQSASLVVMNYTLQFLPVKERLQLLKKIKKALLPGGFFYLSEKVRSEDPVVQETTTRIYEDFKRRQGYSQDEISRKKEALDNVLVPLSEKQQIAMLKEAGFNTCEVTMKWHNFTTFVAM